MNIKQTILLPLIAVLALIMSCDQDKSSSTTMVSKEDKKAFEQSAYNKRQYLLHEHTYDKANIPVADSIYAESEKYDSDYGRMIALQIKYYVYVADTAHGDEFVKTIDEFLSLAKKTDQKDDFYDAMNAKLYFYLEKQKYMDALYMVKEVMKEAEKENDPLGLYFCNYMMANIYQTRSNDAIAIPYLLKAEKYAQSDSLKRSLVTKELSVNYSNIKKHDIALEKAEECMRYAPTTVYKVFAEYQYLTCLAELKRNKDFIDFYKKSYIRTHNVDGILPEHMQLQLKSRLCLCKGDYEGAIRYTNEIVYDNVRDNELLTIYYTMGDFKKAYDIRVVIDEAKDSLQANMQMDDLNDLDARLGNNILKMESEKLKTRNQYIIFIAIIVILAVISLFVGFLSIRRRKHLRELDAKNQELDIKNHELQAANELAARASEAKSIFIGNMSHELNTPLNHVYGFAQMIADQDMTSTIDDYKQMAQYICDGSNQLKHIIDNITLVSDKLAKLQKLEEVESVLKLEK